MTLDEALEHCEEFLLRDGTWRITTTRGLGLASSGFGRAEGLEP